MLTKNPNKDILTEVVEGENYFLNIMEGVPYDEIADILPEVTKTFYFWNLVLSEEAEEKKECIIEIK